MKPYKRSLSGGRDVTAYSAIRDRDSSVGPRPSSDLAFDRSSIYRRSLSKTRYDTGIGEKHSRSSSHCRDSIGDVTDESTKSFLSDQTKYKADSRSQSSSTLSPTGDGLPPIGGCVSPPPLPGDVTLRRRSTPKRVSRFLRPDFFDTPREESIYVGKDNKDRDSESRKILHEIRERSRERSLDRARGSSSDRLNYYIDKYSANSSSGVRSTETDATATPRAYSRHSSVEGFSSSSRDNILAEYAADRQRRRSLSKSKDNSMSHIPQSNSTILREENSKFADAIINELQSISNSHQKLILDDEQPNVSRTKSREVMADSENRRKSEEREKSVEKRADSKINDIQMVTNMTNEIDSISPLNVVVKTRESRLARPKSYPSKNVNRRLCDDSENDKSETSQSNSEPVTEPTDTVTVTVRCARPKSYPNSKLTPPKDVKKEDSPGEVVDEKKVVKPEKSNSKVVVSKTTTTTETETKKTVKKVIKTVKKTIKKPTTTTIENPIEEVKDKSVSPEENGTKKPVVKLKEASPEKKVNKGFLYSIGQKFEKFRENSKASKEKKIESQKQPSPPPIETPSSTTMTSEAINDAPKTIKLEKKSKIDTVIRNLREISVPKSPQMTESRLLKRAVSVEDMSGINTTKYGVNKVLGLFKKYESQTQNANRIKSTKSTSNVENTMNHRILERPKTTIGPPITTRKLNQYRGAKSDTILTATEQAATATKGTAIQTTSGQTKIPKFNCAECTIDVSTNVTLPMPPSSGGGDSVTKRHSNFINESLTGADRKEELKNKRKGLLLDLSKVDADRTSSNNNNGFIVNGNVAATLSTNKQNNNINNNNNYYSNNHSGHDLNRNKPILAEEQYDNLINYSSDLRSPYDETASTSTLFSPTDEPELYFDNWSVCSDDHTRPHTSPSTSRYSSNHYVTSPPPPPNDNESIVDRIRRKSFYTRFNEKKPKRVSTIVGPGASKEFYRDTSASRVTRPPVEYKQRAVTTSLDQPRNTHEYYRPMKTGENSYNLNGSMTRLAPSSSYDKLNGDRAAAKVSTSFNHSHHHHHHSHHHAPLPPTTKLLHHNASDGSNYSSYRSHLPPTPTSTVKRPTSTIYDGTSFPSTYSSATYNPRLSGSSLAMLSGRSSPYSNGSSALGSTGAGGSNLDSYSTLGRKIRPYDQRSISLLSAAAGLSTTSKLNKLGGLTSGGGGSSSSSSNGGLGRDSLILNRDQRLSTDFGSISRYVVKFF